MSAVHRYWHRLGATFFAISVLAAPLSVFAKGQTVLYRLTLPNGTSAVVYTDGVAQMLSKDGRVTKSVIVKPGPQYDGKNSSGKHFDQQAVVGQLLMQPRQPYAPDRVIVVYRDGVQAPQDVVSVGMPALRSLRTAISKGALASASIPAYTSSVSVNRTLGTLGVDRSERLFRNFNRSALSALRSSTSSNGRPMLNPANAYRLHVTAMAVPEAVRTLEKLPDVAYVSADWTVTPLSVPPIAVRSDTLRAAQARNSAMRYRPMTSNAAEASTLPPNYVLQSSGQSLLNAAGIDDVAAYDEIVSRFHQLPGQGELITNVSIGDLDDASATSNANDPCNLYATFYGPTTIMQGGQRYLDLPSMPLIPAYTADQSGNLSGAGEVCGLDPALGEIGLDFSMMSPLPHDLQRAGEQGSGLTDLLGIAPGATYRLIVPASFSPTISDIDGALLGAALQTPRPNVITTSLGFGEDQYGFPSRYLEEDPLTESIIAAIVQQDRIVVCVSGGDGTRTFTNVAIGPSGGSAPTEVAPNGGATTSLNDDYLSSIPSVVLDSGSIDVGGTTLDDIFANPPQYAMSPQAVAQHAYAETRWTGFTNLSTGFGPRVNVSAPADNVLSLQHAGSTADAVAVSLEGGTSASAPEAAAAAAVLLQLGNLTGRPLSPSQVRQLFEQTGSPVSQVPQADVPLSVGPQLDLRAAVEQLLGRSGPLGRPNVARIAVEQRRDYALLDGAFLSDTDPTNIALGPDPTTGLPDRLAWITIAPDWEFIPRNATYRLFVAKHATQPLAQTPWARLQPATILAAAGLSLPSSSPETVTLTYEALTGAHVVASANVALTFEPVSGTLSAALAPRVPPVVNGPTVQVSYDVSNNVVNNPQIVVSEPGRVDPDTGNIFHPVYTAPLPSLKGSVNVPVSALQGGGIYGVGVELDSTNQIYSDFAFTRVATVAQRPAAPLLSSNGSTPGHLLDVPYGASFQVTYDVRNVAGATGAMLEVSAPAPGPYNIYNPFNNPNGTTEDKNGVDTGSIYYAPLPGTTGSVTLNALTVGLSSALEHVVRIIPMRFGRAAGEASDVSTIAMDGVVPEDGGYVIGGWGINADGTDGFLTSRHTAASGELVSSLETFNQPTNQITDDAASAPAGSGFLTYGNPVYGGDVGLFADENIATGATSYGLLDTIASGTLGPTWAPPFPSTFFIQGAAQNTANDVAAFIGYDQTTNDYDVFTSDLLARTFSSLYDVSAPIKSLGFSFFTAIGEDPSTNTVVLPVFIPSKPVTEMETVNLTNGTVTSFAGVGGGFVQSIAVDPVTHKAAVTTADGGMTIYDLTSHTGTEVMIPGGGQFVAADPKDALFIVQQVQAPNFQTDNNTLSSVLVYDENGNLIKTLERFNFWNDLVEEQSNGFQVDPNTRTGYYTGFGQNELGVFQY